MEDKLQDIFPLFKKYKIDSYLHRSYRNKQEDKDLCLIWSTVLFTVLLAILLIFAFLR